MKYKRIMIIFLLVFLSLDLISCSIINRKEMQEKQLNLYIGVKDKESLNAIKILTDFYQKKNPDVKLNINNIIGDKIDYNIGEKNDILFINRWDMLDLAHRGLISDMKNFFKENDIVSRYYSIMKVYGRFNDKYYGVPIMPCTLEFLYNKNSFDKLKISAPDTLADFENIMKKFNSGSDKIPAILGENIDVNNAIFSIVSNNNLIPMRRLENMYDSRVSEYGRFSYIQNVFKDINELVKKNVINKNIFEMGNEVTLDKFNNGDIPMVLVSSYYVRDLNSRDISSINDKLPVMKTPVISNVLMCVPNDSDNTDEIEQFMKFSFGDGMQKEFSKRGYVTCNKAANKNNKGVKADISSHLKNASEDNIAIIQNIPHAMKSDISDKIDDIFSGKYAGNEWNEIIKKEQQ